MMKKYAKQIFVSLLGLLFFGYLSAQSNELQYYRFWDQRGINVFEPLKNNTATFNGLYVRVGGDFTQQFQGITHSNKADAANFTSGGKTYNANALYPLGAGFNLATANLNFDIQIEDGIRICLENYMSARHHNEFWVKGGYIQIDKLPMFNSPAWFTDNFRVKIGHFMPNYGDQQFRRTDNGNAMFNPFVGNYILDAFTTEIATEIYAFPMDNVMLMAGMTGGLISGDVKDYTGTTTKKHPCIYFKAAFDKEFNDLRFRFSASLYQNAGTVRNTLFGGDRTGSRYYFAMEPEYIKGTTGLAEAVTPATRHTSGRINPGFTNELVTFQVSPFLKYKGMEVFATYERGSGKTNAETETRTFSQMVVEGVFRFLPNEQAFIGARYNKTGGRLQGFAADISINRTSISAGWLPSKNLLLKAELVNQKYIDYPSTHVYAGGEFKGVMIEAVIGF
jgi:hypothetical protein